MISISIYKSTIESQVATRCVLLVLVIIAGCSHNECIQNEELPEYIEGIENLRLFPVDVETPYSIDLIKETIFESNDEIFWGGYIRRIAVDNNDRVYLAVVNSNNVDLYIYEPDGSFSEKRKLKGRGMGEFEDISSLEIWDKKLLVFGANLQKFAIFSIADFSLINESLVSKDLIGRDDMLAGTLRGFGMKVNNKGDMFIKMSSLSLNKQDELAKVIYHKIKADGSILPDRVLELDDFKLYYPTNGNFPIQMPFIRSKRVAFSGNGYFYTIWTEDFLVKRYDSRGKYLGAYYYPLKKQPLNINKLEVNSSQRRILNNYNLPESWQAVRTIETDNKNRLWVSTITESERHFKWWVIDQSGEIIAKFTLEGNRNTISPMSVPLIKIKNNHFYKLERDIEKGIERIVKYRINLNKKAVDNL